MAVAPFDARKHHIGLQEADNPVGQLGFVTSGSYNLGFRREKESEFDGVRFGGGDSLVNKPGISSWTMDDFTGGAFQYVWGKDQAMFARSKNALPSQFDRSIRSVPALQEWLNGTRFASTEVPMTVLPFNGYLYALYQGSIQRWNLATGVRTSDALIGSGTTYRGASLRERNHILRSVDGVVHAIDIFTFAGDEYSFSPPSGAFAPVTGMSGTGDRLLIAYKDTLWNVRLGDNWSVPPAAGDFTRIGRLPGSWVNGPQSSCWASGLCYILLQGYDSPTQLVAFDGTQILPICEFPYNFLGQSVCAYGGRIYVGGTGADVQTGAPKYAELYEVTGASLRLLKTFAPEQMGGGEVYGQSIYSMVVHEGLLFFGVKGWGLMAYDLTTDSFYGSSNLAVADSNAEFRHLVSARDSLFSYLYPIAVAASNGGWYRPATSQETVSSYTTELETSDFAVAFDRTKRWRQLKTLTRFVTSTLTVDYSVNGGLSWTALPAPTFESSGRFQLWTIDLSPVPESRSIRFRFKIANGTDVSAFRELVGFTASFRFLNSDSVGSGEQEKLAWSFVICGSELVEASDRSTLQQDVAGIHAQLWAWARGRRKLNFRDLDGGIYTVEIDTLEENQPTVLPELPVESFGDGVDNEISGTGREAFYRITLVEV